MTNAIAIFRTPRPFTTPQLPSHPQALVAASSCACRGVFSVAVPRQFIPAHQWEPRKKGPLPFFSLQGTSSVSQARACDPASPEEKRVIIVVPSPLGKVDRAKRETDEVYSQPHTHLQLVGPSSCAMVNTQHLDDASLNPIRYDVGRAGNYKFPCSVYATGAAHVGMSGQVGFN